METTTLDKLTKATVTRVLDGDTIDISSGERIRFIGIDAPELNAPGGTESTDFVRDLILNKSIWLEADGNDKDRNGRLRRYVWTREPTDSDDKKQIQRYQLNAMLLSLGLAKVLIIGNVRHEALFYKLANVTFIGTKSSKVLHLNICRSVPDEHNRIIFQTRREAITAGYRECKHCKP